MMYVVYIICRSEPRLRSLPYVTYDTWAKSFYGEDALSEDEVNQIIAKEEVTKLQCYFHQSYIVYDVS